MYNLEQIKRVGLVHIGGGLLVALVGAISEGLFSPRPDWFNSFLYNISGLALFGFGWYIFNQFVMGQTYANLKKSRNYNNRPMQNTNSPANPPRRLGLDYQGIEIAAMLLAAVLVMGVNWLIKSGPDTSSSGFSLGGFAGGWLIGGGFARLRFVRKSHALELEQERQFYFSDANVGPRTELAFYEEKPGKRTLEEVQLEAQKETPKNLTAKTLAETATPPGVKRRAGSEVKSNTSSTNQIRKRAKIEPLIPSGTATKPEDKDKSAK